MAVILVKVGDTFGYRDGAIIEVFNRRKTGFVHAWHICDHRRLSRNPDGTRKSDWRTAFLDARHTMRGTMISRSEMLKQTFDRMGQVVEESIVGPATMRVGAYFDHQLSNPQHRVFRDEKGRPYIHGGDRFHDAAFVDIAWDLIGSHTNHIRGECPCGTNHEEFPFGRLDLRHHLGIRVDDMDDVEAEKVMGKNYRWREFALVSMRATMEAATNPRMLVGIQRNRYTNTLDHAPLTLTLAI